MQTPALDDRALLSNLREERARTSDSLRKIRDELEDLQSNHLVFPFNSLPKHLIAMIFEFCLPEYPVCPPMHGLRSPTRFLVVCKMWKDIALSTASLWRGIDLSSTWPSSRKTPFTERYHDTSEPNHPLVALWLERSKALPISLYAAYPSDTGSDKRAMMDLLFSHRERWECVKMHLNTWDYPEFVGPFPKLRFIELDNESSFMSADSSVSFKPFDVPLLRAVTLWDIKLSSASTLGLLPWAQLTGLVLIYPDDALGILRQTTRLVHLEFRTSGDEQSFHFPRVPPTVVLPSLRSLVFGRYDYDYEYTAPRVPSSYYIQCIVAPALRSLRVDDLLMRPDPIGALHAFVQRSRCTSLEEVCIMGGRSRAEKTYRRALGTSVRVWFDSCDEEGWTNKEEQARSRKSVMDVARG
uniref:F-box domain-containing protein n=1 Tax=Mycena chlorophos TaxID=658473 RepID=A0ABQ0LSQ2_MYCCL|nr:predicted protein [Mycena chlorophos]